MLFGGEIDVNAGLSVGREAEIRTDSLHHSCRSSSWNSRTQGNVSVGQVKPAR